MRFPSFLLPIYRPLTKAFLNVLELHFVSYRIGLDCVLVWMGSSVNENTPGALQSFVIGDDGLLSDAVDKVE